MSREDTIATLMPAFIMRIKSLGGFRQAMTHCDHSDMGSLGSSYVDGSAAQPPCNRAQHSCESPLHKICLEAAKHPWPSPVTSSEMAATLNPLHIQASSRGPNARVATREHTRRRHSFLGQGEREQTYLVKRSVLFLWQLTVHEAELRSLAETEGTVVGIALRKTADSLLGIKGVECDRRSKAGGQLTSWRTSKRVPVGESPLNSLKSSFLTFNRWCWCNAHRACASTAQAHIQPVFIIMGKTLQSCQAGPTSGNQGSSAETLSPHNQYARRATLLTSWQSAEQASREERRNSVYSPTFLKPLYLSSAVAKQHQSSFTSRTPLPLHVPFRRQLEHTFCTRGSSSMIKSSYLRPICLWPVALA